MAVVMFVGVTTGASLIHRAMPLWEPLLGAACELRGIDVPVGSDDEIYTGMLDDLTRDDSAAGAVITTHKVRVFEACRARFASLDALAVSCEEINAVRRSADGLHGSARDPASVGRVLDRIWPDAEGQVICLGAGGAGLALAHHLLASRPDVRLVCADASRAAAERLTRQTQGAVTVHVGDGPWDDLISAAAPGSLIVNATGMGKDRPGSPITSSARFPPRAVIWELNYRGELQFLDQSLLQAERSHLEVHDGWQLFCHGWAAALGAVLDLPDDEQLGDRFTEAAQPLRPGTTVRLAASRGVIRQIRGARDGREASRDRSQLVGGACTHVGRGRWLADPLRRAGRDRRSD